MKLCSKREENHSDKKSACSQCENPCKSKPHLSDEVEDSEKNQTEYVGTREASQRLNVSISTLSRWCRQGKIPGSQQDAPGSPWRIPVDFIEKMLAKKKNK